MHLFGVDALSSEEAGRIVGGGRDGLAVVWRHVGAGMLATLVLVLIELEEDE